MTTPLTPEEWAEELIPPILQGMDLLVTKDFMEELADIIRQAMSEAEAAARAEQKEADAVTVETVASKYESKGWHTSAASCRHAAAAIRGESKP